MQPMQRLVFPDLQLVANRQLAGVAVQDMVVLYRIESYYASKQLHVRAQWRDNTLLIRCQPHRSMLVRAQVQHLSSKVLGFSAGTLVEVKPR